MEHCLQQMGVETWKGDEGRGSWKYTWRTREWRRWTGQCSWRLLRHEQQSKLVLPSGFTACNRRKIAMHFSVALKERKKKTLPCWKTDTSPETFVLTERLEVNKQVGNLEGRVVEKVKARKSSGPKKPEGVEMDNRRQESSGQKSFEGKLARGERTVAPSEGIEGTNQSGRRNEDRFARLLRSLVDECAMKRKRSMERKAYRWENWSSVSKGTKYPWEPTARKAEK